MPWTQASPALTWQSRFARHVLTTVGVAALPALLVMPSGGADVRQSSRKHSLFEQPAKTNQLKAMSKHHAAPREPTLSALRRETELETIRINVGLLTGRSTGLPCKIVLGFLRTRAILSMPR